MPRKQVIEAPSSTLICIDLGTTSTRVWRVSGDGRPLARFQAPVGVRDTAREGSPALLRRTLQGLIRQASAPIAGCAAASRVIAAGMITSSLGLLEVPHIPAPTGLAELAAATKPHVFPNVTDLPVLLVPGVRCAPVPGAEPAPVGATDLMRGEETLCVGLHGLGRAAGGAMVLNLGSHWKAIGIDTDGRIVSSVTTLSGELMHAVHERTILSSALPAERPVAWDPQWVEAGMREERASGLGRALFCVRLLQLEGKTTPQERQAYLAGTFIAADMGLVAAAAASMRQTRILLAGNPALARAWQDALEAVSIQGVVLDEPTVESAMLTGLCAIHARMRGHQGTSDSRLDENHIENETAT